MLRKRCHHFAHFIWCHCDVQRTPQWSSHTCTRCALKRLHRHALAKWWIDLNVSAAGPRFSIANFQLLVMQLCVPKKECQTEDRFTAVNHQIHDWKVLRRSIITNYHSRVKWVLTPGLLTFSQGVCTDSIIRIRLLLVKTLTHVAFTGS